MKPFTFAALTLTLATPLATAGVINVGPTATFTSVYDAVAAAAAGDVILVQPGTYANTSGQIVIDKTLSIIGSGSGVTHLDYFTDPVTGDSLPLLVTGLEANEEVRLAGFSILQGTSGGTALRAEHSKGPITVADVFSEFSASGVSAHEVPAAIMIASCTLVSLDSCHFVNLPGGISPDIPIPRVGLYVTSSTLLITDSTIRSQDILAETTDPFGQPIRVSARPGMVTSNSTVHIENSRIGGGRGSDSVQDHAGNGGSGIAAITSTLNIRGGANHLISGGDAGALGSFPFSFPFGYGGLAIDALFANTLTTTADLNLTAGTNADGSIPLSAIVIPGPHTQLPEAAISMDVQPSVAGLGSTVNYQLNGEPLSACMTAFSFGQQPLSFPGWAFGPLVLDTASTIVLPLTFLDATGNTQFVRQVPSAPALSGFSMMIQTLAVSPSATASLSMPSMLAIH